MKDHLLLPGCILEHGAHMFLFLSIIPKRFDRIYEIPFAIVYDRSIISFQSFDAWGYKPEQLVHI